MDRFEARKKGAVTHTANANVDDRRDYDTGSFHVKSSDSACMYIKSFPFIEGKIIDKLKDTKGG